MTRLHFPHHSREGPWPTNRIICGEELLTWTLSPFTEALRMFRVWTEDKVISDPREITKLDPDLTREIRFRARISLSALAALNGRLPKAEFIPIKSLGFSAGKSYLAPPFLGHGTISCSSPLLGVKNSPPGDQRPSLPKTAAFPEMLKPGQVQANWDIWSPTQTRTHAQWFLKAPLLKPTMWFYLLECSLPSLFFPGRKRNWGCVGGTYANPKAVQLSVVTCGGHGSCPRPVVSTLGWTLDNHKRRRWVGGKQGS